MWRTTLHTSNVPREKPKQKSTLPPQSFKGNPILPPPPTNKGEVHLSLRNPGAYLRSSLLKKQQQQQQQQQQQSGLGTGGFQPRY